VPRNKIHKRPREDSLYPVRNHILKKTLDLKVHDKLSPSSRCLCLAHRVDCWGLCYRDLSNLLPIRPVGNDNTMPRELIHGLAVPEACHVGVCIARARAPALVHGVILLHVLAAILSLVKPSEIRDGGCPDVLVSSCVCAECQVQHSQEHHREEDKISPGKRLDDFCLSAVATGRVSRVFACWDASPQGITFHMTDDVCGIASHRDPYRSKNESKHEIYSWL